MSFFLITSFIHFYPKRGRISFTSWSAKAPGERIKTAAGNRTTRLQHAYSSCLLLKEPTLISHNFYVVSSYFFFFLLLLISCTWLLTAPITAIYKLSRKPCLEPEWVQSALMVKWWHNQNTTSSRKKYKCACSHLQKYVCMHIYINLDPFMPKKYDSHGSSIAHWGIIIVTKKR